MANAGENCFNFGVLIAILQKYEHAKMTPRMSTFQMHTPLPQINRLKKDNWVTNFKNAPKVTSVGENGFNFRVLIVILQKKFNMPK